MRKDSNDTNANRNQTVKWCLQQSFIDLDDRLLKFINPVRGVYGIFIKDKDQKICVYVGKAENLYSRMFSDNGHLVRIRKGKHTNPKLNEEIEKGQTVCIELLEEVPYNKGNCTETDYNRDMQRLASAECKHIDFYQNKGECLWQLPEGKHLSFDEWRKK